MKRNLTLTILLISFAFSFALLTAQAQDTIAVIDTEFSADPTLGKKILVVQFTNETTGQNTTADSCEFLWDFGDGETSNEPQPVHVYLDPGVYDVSLTVTDTTDDVTDVELKEDFITVYGVDFSIAIDRSSSMELGRLAPAQNAASQFIQRLELQDEIAIVSYSNTARLELGVMKLVEPTDYSSATNAVNAIQPFRYTSIGAGLVGAAVQLTEVADVITQDNVNTMVPQGLIIMTDGLENTIPLVQQVIGNIPDYMARFAVQFGDVDAGLQAIAQIVNSNDANMINPLTAQQCYINAATTTNLDLAFEDIYTCITKESLLERSNGPLSAKNREMEFTVDESMRNIVINLCWSDPNIELDFDLSAPHMQRRRIDNPSTLTRNDSFETQRISKYSSLEPGTYKIKIRGGQFTKDLNHMLSVSAYSPVKQQSELNGYDFNIFDPIVINTTRVNDINSLNAVSARSNTSATAIITKPDNSIAEITMYETLGGHFSGQFTQTDIPGMYYVEIRTLDNQTKSKRYERRCFYVNNDMTRQNVNDVITFPENYSLSNYPDPFNPSTTIDYQIPKEEHVDITIYDVRGRKVNTLISETKTPGKYSVNWNGVDSSGKNVGSGVYFYRLKTKSVDRTEKMLLLK